MTLSTCLLSLIQLLLRGDQVLEPNLAKGRRVMVFCNTLGSCRAVDHFLQERGTNSVNYHGAVPAEER